MPQPKLTPATWPITRPLLVTGPWQLIAVATMPIVLTSPPVAVAVAGAGRQRLGQLPLLEVARRLVAGR